MLEAFLYSFINTYISDEPPHPPVSIKTLGFIGRHGKRYSLEAWTCGVKDLGRLWMYDDFTKMCARTVSNALDRKYRGHSLIVSNSEPRDG